MKPAKISVWWTSDEYKNDNKPCSEAAWADLKAKAVKELSGKRCSLSIHSVALTRLLV